MTTTTTTRCRACGEHIASAIVRCGKCNTPQPAPGPDPLAAAVERAIRSLREAAVAYSVNGRPSSADFCYTLADNLDAALRKARRQP